MGFQKPNLGDARHAILSSLTEISSPYNDGYVSQACKRDLYVLKCWLEDRYEQLPKFADEQEWEQERLLDILKRKEKNASN